MPSQKKSDSTRMLVQIPRDVHRAADERRRTERTTWGRIVTELLRRWAAGADDRVVAGPIRRARPLAPDPARGDTRANTLWVDPASVVWHRSLADVFRAEAARQGRVIPPGSLSELDDDDGVHRR